MPYTIWSRGRLIGETDLGFIYRRNRYRVGWFHPNPAGERLMPIATGVSPALRADYMIGPDPTTYADILAAVDQCEALELELHGLDGQRIETEDIGIVDTHYLLSLPDGQDGHGEEYEDSELSPEQQAEIDEFVADWRAHHSAADEAVAESQGESEMPRYQVQIRFVHDMLDP
jgi:hypothetical protein